MRNPLKRLLRDHPRMPLRERLDAAKDRLAAMRDKASRIVAVNRVMLRMPDMRPKPAVALDPEKQDTGERPRLPLGFPSPDAELLDALDLLRRTRDAQEAFLRISADGADQHPAYLALETAWDDALDRLSKEPARTLSGLQAKARALRMSSGCMWPDDLVKSLIADLLDADERALEPLVDAAAPEQPGGSAERASIALQPDSPDVSNEYGGLPDPRSVLVGFDISRLPMRTLCALHGTADLVADIGNAISCQPRCGVEVRSPVATHNAAGHFAAWIASVANWLQDDIRRRARDRSGLDWRERQERLEILASAAISDGDPAEMRAFAHDLMAEMSARG